MKNFTSRACGCAVVASSVLASGTVHGAVSLASAPHAASASVLNVQVVALLTPLPGESSIGKSTLRQTVADTDLDAGESRGQWLESGALLIGAPGMLMFLIRRRLGD